MSDAVWDAGGVDKLKKNRESQDHRLVREVENLLATLVLTWVARNNGQYSGIRVKEEKYVPRVVCKLKSELRRLAKVRCNSGTRHAWFLDAIQTWCARTLWEKQGYYIADDVPVDRDVDVSRVKAKNADTEADEDFEGCFADDPDITGLPEYAALYVLLAPLDCTPDEVDSLLDARGRFDVREIRYKLGCTLREARETASYLDAALADFKRRVAKVRQMVPRAFRNIYRRLAELPQLDRLAEVELRGELFDLARGLLASFGRENLYGRGVLPLDRPQFEYSVDLLLDEHRGSAPGEYRAVVERSMQAVVNIREALEAGDVGRAFRYAPILMWNAAQMQDRVSAAYPQLLLAYGYTLRLAGQGQEYIRFHKELVRLCDAIVRRVGRDVLDKPPELERGETLRRVRTYAGMNEIVGLFYFEFSSPAEERFLVKDYKGLASLPRRITQVLDDDPKAEFVTEELLVVCAHLVRAAYNLHRGAKEPAEKRRWRTERDTRRDELGALINNYFFDPDRGHPCPQRLIEAAENAGEGAAPNRTLDIIEELLREQRAKDVLAALRAERKAAMPAMGPL